MCVGGVGGTRAVPVVPRDRTRKVAHRGIVQRRTGKNLLRQTDPRVYTPNPLLQQPPAGSGSSRKRICVTEKDGVYGLSWRWGSF